MPWVEATLRGQRVFAKAKADGSFDAEGGRVEIRYRKTDPRAYRAAAGNLAKVPGAAVLPDDACVTGEPVAAGEAKATARGAGGSGRAGTTPAARREAAAAAAQASPRPPGAWIIYTDGACSGNPGPAGAGVVVVTPDGKIREGYRWLGTGTNNIAELTAILLALDALPSDIPAAVIHTDSQYAIGILTKGWKPKANQALVAKIKEALAPRRSHVRFVYVPGHAGVPMNERADELAREAIRTETTRPLS